MSDARMTAVDDAMAGIRRAVEGQLGTERPEWADVVPSLAAALLRRPARASLRRREEPAARAGGGAPALAPGAVPARRRSRDRGRLAQRPPLGGARGCAARRPQRLARARRRLERGLRPVHVQPPRRRPRARLRAVRVHRAGPLPRVDLQDRRRLPADRLAGPRSCSTRRLRPRPLPRRPLPRAESNGAAGPSVADDGAGRDAAARLDAAGRPHPVRVRALRAAQLLRRPDLVVGARAAWRCAG